MTREDLLMNHSSSSMVLIYNGPYSVSDFFAYAIIRKAFFSVFSRYPGFYTTKNMEHAETNPEIDFIRFDHKQGSDTEHAACDAWDEFGGILVSKKETFVRIRENLKNFVDGAKSDYYVFPKASGLSFIFDSFNALWTEDNDALYDGKKKMFYIRKRVMVEGIVTASKMLERLMISAENDIEMKRMFDRAYEKAVVGEDDRLLLVEDHVPHVAIVLYEPTHVHNVTDMIYLHSEYASNIRIFIQANYDECSNIIGYVAQVVDHDDGFNFADFHQYCKEKLAFESVNLLSDNGMIVGITSNDEGLILSFCANAYRMWYESKHQAAPLTPVLNFTSEYDKEPEVEETDVKVEDAHAAGRLYDPFKDKLADLSTKFLHLFKKKEE